MTDSHAKPYSEIGRLLPLSEMNATEAMALSLLRGDSPLPKEYFPADGPSILRIYDERGRLRITVEKHE